MVRTRGRDMRNAVFMKVAPETSSRRDGTRARLVRRVVVSFGWGILVAGCAVPGATGGLPSVPSTTPTASLSVATRVPADSTQPASGNCPVAPGTVVTFEVHQDAPSPRCWRVGADQRLRVLNPPRARSGQSAAAVTITFAGYAPRILQPGQSTTFERPMGDYLAPGVHSLTISLYPAGGAEVWLK